MGGPLPLGYDVDNRLLVINEVEARLVRRIFDDFVTMRSATLIATDGIERRREINDRQSEPVLLRGLLFTSDGERLVPSYTQKKNGKTYRYYSPIKHRHLGARASRHGPLPAVSIEELVAGQIVAVLSVPHLVQAVWDRIRVTRPDLIESQVVLTMRNLAGLWRELFPAEQCRLAQLLIERV